MKMKKFLALVCAGALTLCLAACGGNPAAPDNPGSVDKSPPPSDAAPNITLVLSQRDEWLSALVDGAAKAAAELGVNLSTVDCRAEASKSVQFVEAARDAGEQVVIVNLIDPALTERIVEAAGEMKIVFVHCPPDDMSRLTDSVVYVGSDEAEAGRYQGEALAEYFQSKGQTEIKYILLNGVLGQQSTNNRTVSVLQTLVEKEITASEAATPLVADNDRLKAMDMMKLLLDENPEYDCIISNNDAMALGAIEALESLGMNPGEKPIVGMDCDADSVAAVADGKLYMTAFQNADSQGRGAVRAAVNLLNGVPINEGADFDLDAQNPHILWIPFERVDASNAADYQ